MLKINLKLKLISLLLAFSLIPIGVVGYSLWRATELQQEQSLGVYGIFAQQLADSIDRNLFERYGDVQAFALNQAVVGAKDDPSRLVEAMNGYVAKYGLYPLMLFVDTDGVIVATNTLNAAGEPVSAAGLIGESVAGEAWFDQLERRDYTTRQPFTAPGNQQVTGTVIVDLHIDDRVVAVDPTHTGAVLGFGAPVEREGQLLGYWYNLADLVTVEEIFEATYQRFKAMGLGSTQMNLLDGRGTIIIDFDPSETGSETVTRTDAFMSLNLVERGVEAAKQAVAGRTGTSYSLNSRKQIWQASGYSHLVGAMGYPGMNWSVLVRTARAEQSAVPIAQRRLLMIEAGVLAIIAVLGGLFFGHSITRPIQTMTDIARKMSRGDLRQRITVKGNDEVAALGGAINSIADYLGEAVNTIDKSIESIDNDTSSMFGLIEGITSGTSETSQRAQSVSAAAEEMSVTITHVSESAEQSNSSLQQVAGGADEMASTIREIAESTERARSITTTAVGNVAQASDRVADLSRASAEISRIIDVILEIAEQTKLLALNATIEAARAGEAGKGFAVVASEVKDLALQTNNATEEIRDSITAIQASTGLTVDEIGTIKDVIGEVSHIVSGIAAAVEEQSVTTDNMAGNITQSAEVVAEMNSNFTEVDRTSGEIATDISEVNRSINDVNSAMAMIDASAKGLSAMSQELKEITNKFKVR